MKPGDREYEEVWVALLKSFAAHLKEKGWFDITHISMDERPMPVMQETLKVIRKADPDFKVSLAGALHEELSDELDDYCVALRMKYPEEMKDKRRAEGNKRSLSKIKTTLDLFDETTLDSIPASEVVSKANRIINAL